MTPNHSLAFAAALVAALALGACGKFGTHSNTSRVSMAPDPSTQVIGVKPADPTPEPPGTTPVDNSPTTQIPQVQAQTGPKEGDANSHSSDARGQQSAPVKKEASS